MSAQSKIEWTDATWNPVTGCSKVSQGCKFCYAETLAKGRLSHLPEYAGGFEKVICHTDRLTIPSKWKKGKKIFVNSMSDLFHEDVPFEFIDDVFTVMMNYDYHTYQILTKRIQRALAWFEWKSQQMGFPWKPKANIWIGVSVENQEAADERIPLLTKIPAAVRFLSCEPLLGPIDLKKFFYMPNPTGAPADIIPTHAIHWVIVGGESGHKARPMHFDWILGIMTICILHKTPFFFKQWGEYKHGGSGITKISKWVMVGNDGIIYPDLLPKGKNCMLMSKVGKKHSGSKIGPLEFKEFPTIK